MVRPHKRPKLRRDHLPRFKSSPINEYLQNAMGMLFFIHGAHARWITPRWLVKRWSINMLNIQGEEPRIRR